jgi:LacI family transcriptional regulator
MKQKQIKRVLLASAWQSYDLAAGVARYAVEASWHLDMSFFISGELPKDWKGEGILVLAGDGRMITRLFKIFDCPIVSLTVNRNGLNIPYADADNAKAGMLAAEHFLERNFRHFACYGLTDWPVDRLRCGGFAGKIAQAGHSCELLIWNRSRGTRKDSWDNRQKWLKQMLGRLPKPLGIFAVDDLRAVELIEAGLRLELRIPEDIAILGVGNHSLLSNTTSIPLSSVAIDETRIGYEAAVLLDRCMQGRQPPKAPCLITPSGVIARKSTETIATEHPEVSKAVRFMLNHYHESLSVVDIVASTALSQTRLYQAFNAEFGQSPARFLTRMRLDHAKKSLSESSRKLTTIAEECGFGDTVNLFRIFKRYEVIAPAKWKQTRS